MEYNKQQADQLLTWFALQEHMFVVQRGKFGYWYNNILSVDCCEICSNKYVDKCSVVEQVASLPCEWHWAKISSIPKDCNAYSFQNIWYSNICTYWTHNNISFLIQNIHCPSNPSCASLFFVSQFSFSIFLFIFC